MSQFVIIAGLKIVVLILSALFLFYRLARERDKSVSLQDSGNVLQYFRSKRALLILLAFISVVCFFNMGTFHGVILNRPRYVHYWEMFHYYVGSKYFKELGYFDLYNATVVADAEDEGFLEDRHEIMDLRNYHLISRGRVLEKADYYKSLFSPRRWQEFKSDVRFFRQASDQERFARMVRDHGYNPSPLWNTTGSILSNLISVKYSLFLTLLDIFILVIMFAIVGYSFGIETMLMTLIFFSTNFISSFYWIGGSFLRYDWLVASVVALCMIRKNRYATAGALLSYAAMVRIFPVFFLFGIAIKAAVSLVRRRVIPRKYLNLFISFILATVVLFAYSCSLGKGVESWRIFADNIKYHSQTLLTNNVGYKTVFLYDEAWLNFDTFVDVYGKTGENPYIVLTDVKRTEFDDRKVEFLLASIMSLFLFFFIVGNKDDTEAFAWGIFLIFMLLAPTCYYYSFLMMLMIVFYKRRINLINTLYLVLLLVVQIIGYVIDFYEDFLLHIYYELSFVMFNYFLFLAISELYRKLRHKEG